MTWPTFKKFGALVKTSFLSRHYSWPGKFPSLQIQQLIRFGLFLVKTNYTVKGERHPHIHFSQTRITKVLWNKYSNPNSMSFQLLEIPFFVLQRLSWQDCNSELFAPFPLWCFWTGNQAQRLRPAGRPCHWTSTGIFPNRRYGFLQDNDST